MGGIKKYMQPIEVDNINILKSLPNHQKGEIAIVKDEQKNYVYVDEEKGWVPLKANIESNGLKMNLYELNKSIVSQLPVFDDNAWNGTEKVVNDQRELTENIRSFTFCHQGCHSECCLQHHY